MKVKVKPTDKKIEGIMRRQNYETILDMVANIKKKVIRETAEYSELSIISQFFN